MEKATAIVLDLAKRVFQVHGATAGGRVAFRKKLSRGAGAGIFRALAALYGGHGGMCHGPLLGSEIGALGHEIRLAPSAYVSSP
jgi:transposase